ncbi:MAG: DUF362 domain-containing protein [Nanoarchaeota archaeon]|nr:DUF362 domain-containing protein [Nanoarchaeota archaeon]MBU2442181.1 DUF362 domain-containing protein [Nanoarchaeota archaeon]
MTKVHLIKEIKSDKYEKVLEQQLKSNFKKGMNVAVKLHMGESNKGKFNPELAKRAVKVLKKLGCKPFLFDTNVWYPGARHFSMTHKAAVAHHGFSEENIGCPIVVADDFVVTKIKHFQLKVFKPMVEADAMLVLTHFKGHAASAFGGAIKNLAMGCVSKGSKLAEHKAGVPNKVTDDCTACGVCAKLCPFHTIMIVGKKARINHLMCFGCSTCVYNCPSNAIKAKTTFDKVLAEAANAVIDLMKNKSINKPIYYVNEVMNISKNCDCMRNTGGIIAKDVGVLMSTDIVAIEKASLDLVIKQEGKDVFKEIHNHDPVLQIVEAEKLGLGKQKYELS